MPMAASRIADNGALWWTLATSDLILKRLNEKFLFCPPFGNQSNPILSLTSTMARKPLPLLQKTSCAHCMTCN